jgi:hypothetical protein
MPGIPSFADHRTLAMIKPDAYRHIGDIIDAAVNAGFRIKCASHAFFLPPFEHVRISTHSLSHTHTHTHTHTHEREHAVHPHIYLHEHFFICPYALTRLTHTYPRVLPHTHAIAFFHARIQRHTLFRTHLSFPQCLNLHLNVRTLLNTHTHTHTHAHLQASAHAFTCTRACTFRLKH